MMASRHRTYWLAWIAAVIVACAIRFVVFDRDDDRFLLGIGYMLGTWLPIMFLNVYESRLPTSYLEKHHRAKWEELTRRSAFENPAHAISRLGWIYSPVSLGDPEVLRTKREYRQFVHFMLTVFCTYLVIMPILVF